MHCFSRNMISNIYLRHLAIVFLLMLSACSQLPQQKPATAKTEAQLQLTPSSSSSTTAQQQAVVQEAAHCPYRGL